MANMRIGWDEIGDLSQIAAARDAFRAVVAKRMPQLDESSLKERILSMVPPAPVGSFW